MAKYVLDHRDLKASVVAKQIVDLARQRWKTKDVFIDDCTCQIIYIDTTLA